MAKKLNKTKGHAAPEPSTWEHEDGEEVLSQTRRKAAEQRPKIPLFPRFLLASHPKRFRANLVRKRVLPDLEKIAITRGANLVGEDGDTTALEKRYVGEGWTLLPQDIVQGSPGGGKSYLKRVKVSGGYSYMTRWERALKGSPIVLGDQVAYLDFLEWLVDAGHVALPPVHLMAAAADTARSRSDHYARNSDRDPEAKRRSEAWAEREQIWLTELEQLAGDSVVDGEEVED